MQALVLLVCPLILVATILLIDLRTRRRVLADHDAVTYRPSLAVRFAWTTAMTVLLANLFPTRHQNWILLSANLLALLELVRTFRRSLTLTPEGLHWRSLTGSTSLSWDHIACFAEKRSVVGTEYQFFGDEDQVFVLNSAVIPGQHGNHYLFHSLRISFRGHVPHPRRTSGAGSDLRAGRRTSRQAGRMRGIDYDPAHTGTRDHAASGGAEQSSRDAKDRRAQRDPRGSRSVLVLCRCTKEKPHSAF